MFIDLFGFKASSKLPCYFLVWRKGYTDTVFSRQGGDRGRQVDIQYYVRVSC